MSRSIGRPATQDSAYLLPVNYLVTKSQPFSRDDVNEIKVNDEQIKVEEVKLTENTLRLSQGGSVAEFPKSAITKKPSVTLSRK